MKPSSLVTAVTMTSTALLVAVQIGWLAFGPGIAAVTAAEIKWCAYSAAANGKPVTVALFDHPANPRHPAGMFSMTGHFAYLSATPNVWKQPMKLEAGKPLTLRYGVALWDGSVDGKQIEQTYKAWVDLQER